MPGRRTRAESLYAKDAAKLAAAIRSARAAKGLTQEELARACELSLSTVRKIERSAIVEPGFFPVSAILTVLELDAMDLKLPTILRLRRSWSSLRKRGRR